MNLKFVRKYCSIKELDDFEFPEFVVLTGVNGSGKTHLLKAMESNCIELYCASGIMSNVKYVDFNQLNFNDNSYTYSLEQKEDVIVKQIIDKYKKNGILSSVTSVTLDYNHKNLPNEVLDNIVRLKEDLNVDYDKIDTSMYKFWKLHFQEKKAPFEMAKMSEIFTQYYEATIKNDLKKVRNLPSALDDQEFARLYGKEPKKLFNKYLSTLNKDFEVEYDIPNELDLNHKVSIKNKKTGDIIEFNDLSTGEKMFIKVLLVAFSNEIGVLSKPDVILLDEIDSGLHPTMMKKFLDYIKKVFIDDLKINVILTTHSPTTVALVDEKCLYYVNKDMPRLVKISKRDAISKLTSELPFLRVDYEVIRQVFVESEEDEKIYREIYGILFANDQIYKDIPLTFIGSGVNATPNSGNCESVKKFATELLDKGNTNVFGIIDYDNKNNDNKNVFVLAKGKKYSIETCVLDPVLVGMYLIREGCYEKYSLPFTTFTSLSDATEQDFQTISDIVINRLGFCMSETVEIEYANGYKIKVSKDMMEYNGHDLEQIYKDKFNELKKTQKLKSEIVKKIINEYSKYCPNDFVEVFNKIIMYKK